MVICAPSDRVICSRSGCASSATSSDYAGLGPSISARKPRQSSAASSFSNLSFMPPTEVRDNVKAIRHTEIEINAFLKSIKNSRTFRLKEDATTQEIIAAARKDNTFKNIIPPEGAGIRSTLKAIYDHINK